MRILVVLLAFSLATQPMTSYAATTVPPSDQESPMGPYDAHPINDSFQYQVHVSQPPVSNPSPYPVAIGDELIEVAYTNELGQLFDSQLNLSKATAKIIGPDGQVYYGTLSSQDITTLREAGGIVAEELATAIVSAIIGAVVGAMFTYVLDAYRDEQECRRGVITGNLNIVADIRACRAAGRSFEVVNDSTLMDCGASARAICT